MENKPSLDAAVLISLAIGFFSVFGICLVILLGSLTLSRPVGAPLETVTPFEYILLGTEPGISTPAPTESPDAGEDALPPVALTPATNPPGFPVVPFTDTPIPDPNSPFTPGTYDDNDPRIIYSGAWVPQIGVPGAYQNSLHVSSAPGNVIEFSFVGEQARLFYQASPNLGTIRIVIDGFQFDLAQSAGGTSSAEWASSQLINGTHTILITHLSGDSVNLDYVIVPDVVTPSQ